MNLVQIIKDFEQEEKWLNEQIEEHWKKCESSEFANEQDTRNFMKYHCIFERVSFIKSEMESLLKLYKEW